MFIFQSFCTKSVHFHLYSLLEIVPCGSCVNCGIENPIHVAHLSSQWHIPCFHYLAVLWCIIWAASSNLRNVCQGNDVKSWRHSTLQGGRWPWRCEHSCRYQCGAAAYWSARKVIPEYEERLQTAHLMVLMNDKLEYHPMLWLDHQVIPAVQQRA